MFTKRMTLLLFRLGVVQCFPFGNAGCTAEAGAFIPSPDHFYLCSASSSNGSGPRSVPSTAEQHRNHTYDVVTLGNLCVDIFIHVDQVGCAADPPPSFL